jgi:hypothetical protein
MKISPERRVSAVVDTGYAHPMDLKTRKMYEPRVEIPLPPLLLGIICSPSVKPPSLFYWPSLPSSLQCCGTNYLAVQ